MIPGVKVTCLKSLRFSVRRVSAGGGFNTAYGCRIISPELSKLTYNGMSFRGLKSGKRACSVAVESMQIKEPSILLAGTNSRKLVRNLSHLLDQRAMEALQGEIERHVQALFGLGSQHLEFARSIHRDAWRQRASRFYYAALNIKRSVTLHTSGAFSTDSSDHKNIGSLPTKFPDMNTYATRLGNLRDDRNIADYGHDAVEGDLVISPSETEILVVKFCGHAKAYLRGRGVPL